MALVASEIGSALFSDAQATTVAPIVTRAVDSYSGPAHVTLSRGSLRVHANTTALNDFSQAPSSEISVFNGATLIFDRKVSELVTISISLLPTAPDETVIDVELFSGGAHCCFSDLYIYPASNAANVTSFTHGWGSYPRTYVRINGDILIKGSIGTDYSLGNFGGSTSAVILYGFSREGLRDVTRQYPEALERDAARHLSDYNLEAKGRPTADASLACYLADEIRLGNSQKAWSRVRSLYSGSDFDEFATRVREWLTSASIRQP